MSEYLNDGQIIDGKKEDYWITYYANGYNTLRTVTKKVKPVSEMGYMKATISPTMKMVIGDMKATMANTKEILMMAKSKVNGSYMMKTEKAKTAKLHIRMVAEPKPMNFLNFRMYRG